MPLRLAAIDRDGTIVKWIPHLTRQDQLELLPGAAEAIAHLNGQGVTVALLTNQSVVGRGYISLQELKSLHAHLDSLLAEHQARIDHYLVCPHAPSDGCTCRKPSPALLLSLMRDLGVAKEEAALIGDNETDMMTAENGGVLGLRVLSGVPSTGRYSGPEFPDLAAAVDFLVGRRSDEGAHDD